MSADAMHAINALNLAFLRLHPLAARKAVNKLSIDELLELIQNLDATEVISLWNGLMHDVAMLILQKLPQDTAKLILQRADPVTLSRVLVRLPVEQRLQMLQFVDTARQRELNTLVQYPENSAGSLMDPRFLSLDENLTVRDVLQRIRKYKPHFTRQLYLIDAEGKLQSMIEMHRLAQAESTDILSTFIQPVDSVVLETATKEEVVDQLETHHVTDLPVVDIAGRLVGIIRYDALVDAVRDDSSADVQAMVGASRDERALSRVGFVVSKRLPWLSINLLTAFLAASVVGLFENTIAQFTALAVLLPVVAGQSGNTGAQALAVTMRGLALHEIGTSQWLRVARKEVGAGFINGVAIALLTALGVFFWSGSSGLALVIAISMVIAMVAAAFSGVIIPVVLSSLGQDPAQSSSIILTTVTDVVGFFAFLGIATLLSGML